MAQAETAMSAIARDLEREYPRENEARRCASSPSPTRR